MEQAVVAVSVRSADRNALRLPGLYAVEALVCIGSTLLMVGIFFYTERRFGWGLRENFLLAATQGAVYICGALWAHRLSQRWGRRPLLAAVYLLMAAVAVPCALRPTPYLMIAVLLSYAFIVAISWPIIESLISGQARDAELSRRLGMYNLVWSALAAVVAAGNGAIIEHWPVGVFLIPVVVHAASSLLLWINTGAEETGSANETADAEQTAMPLSTQDSALSTSLSAGELLIQRRLALWLSRIALPANYVVIYSLVAMLPSLPTIKAMTPTMATVVTSAWLATRWVTFVVLGVTVWWHSRPRVLLWAAVLMLVAFLGVVIPAARGGSAAVPLMLAWQVGLGAAMGLIYTASLYFGMVLSDGSTEHSGYHEALIGLGSVLGPGAAAAVQWIRPDGVFMGIATIGTLVAISVVAAAIASVRAGQRRADSAVAPSTALHVE